MVTRRTPRRPRPVPASSPSYPAGRGAGANGMDRGTSANGWRIDPRASRHLPDRGVRRRRWRCARARRPQCSCTSPAAGTTRSRRWTPARAAASAGHQHQPQPVAAPTSSRTYLSGTAVALHPNAYPWAAASGCGRTRRRSSATSWSTATAPSVWGGDLDPAKVSHFHLAGRPATRPWPGWRPPRHRRGSAAHTDRRARSADPATRRAETGQAPAPPRDKWVTAARSARRAERRRAGDRVQHRLADPAGVNQAGLTQHRRVLADRGGAHPDPPGQLGRGAAVADRLEHRRAGPADQRGHRGARRSARWRRRAVDRIDQHRRQVVSAARRAAPAG